VSFRYVSGINKPGFNPLAAQTTVTTYEPYLFMWGRNSSGQLGLGNTTDYSSPKQVGSLTTWSVISLGTAHSAAVKTDGTFWSWGSGLYGALGLNNTTSYSSPKQVGALTNWLTCAAGQYRSTVAIKTDGTLWSWGQNAYGQLGLGNTTYYSSPKQVGSLTNWLKLSTGANFVISIKTDGTMWSWGRNNVGQLGLGNITSYSSPKQIGALTTWSAISAAGVGSWCLAIKTDGTMWSWGVNTYGGLGLGNTTDYSSPKQIGALTTWSTPAAGQYWGMAVTTSGALWSWGYNVSGQLGLGNTTYYSSPKQIGALTTWSKVTATFRTGYAVKTNGTFWDWGYNAYGELGDGTSGGSTHKSSPAQVGSLTTWLSISAGYGSAAGLLY